MLTFLAYLCEPCFLLKGSRVSLKGISIWESSVQVHEPVGGTSYSNCNNHAGSPEGVTYVRAESGSALSFRARQRESLPFEKGLLAGSEHQPCTVVWLSLLSSGSGTLCPGVGLTDAVLQRGVISMLESYWGTSWGSASCHITVCVRSLFVINWQNK